MPVFRIFNDSIEYEHRLFARIVAPVSTFRDRAEDEIWTCNPTAHEAKNQAWRDEVEAEQTAEVELLQSKIEHLQSKIDGLRNEIIKQAEVLEAVDGGATCADLIAAAEAETAKWCEIAETNRAAYFAAIKRKPRKRRAP